jgi:hypothetical protein
MPEEDKKNAIKYIQDLVEKTTKVWFVGDGTDAETLSTEIYTQLQATPMKKSGTDPKLEQTDVELFADVSSFRKEARELKAKLLEEFRGIDTEMRDQLKITLDDDFIRALLLIYKVEASNFGEVFYKKLGDQMIGFELYVEYVEFKRSLAIYVEKFEVDAKTKFTPKFQQSNTGTKEGQEARFRKCPHCGLIWFKVTACPNTSCGARLNSLDVWQNGESLCGYVFNWAGSKLTWTVDNSAKQNSCSNKYVSKRKEEPQGCGKSICWDNCEDVTDEVMATLKEANIRDFVAAGNIPEKFDLAEALKFRDTSSSSTTTTVSTPPTASPAPVTVLTPTTGSTTATTTLKFTIRKFDQKRGGNKIQASSLDEILKEGKKLFAKDVVAVRDKEEALVSDFTLLDNDSLLYLITQEEERENF